jgi:hypothetical protein
MDNFLTRVLTAAIMAPFLLRKKKSMGKCMCVLDLKDLTKSREGILAVLWKKCFAEGTMLLHVQIILFNIRLPSAGDY